MSDTPGFSPPSIEDSPSSEQTEAKSVNAAADTAAAALSNSATTPDTPKSGNPWLSYGLCVAGAIIAVVIGTAVFGPDQSLLSKLVVPLFSAVGTGLVVAWHALTATLAVFPWAIVFEVIAGFAVFYVCRMGKTCQVQVGLHVSAIAGIGALAVYLMADSPDMDDLLSAAKGLTICTLLLSFALVTANARAVRHQSGEFAVGTYFGFGLISCALTIILWISWACYSQNTYPDVSKILQQKYGSQLEAMGFEDVNLNHLSSAGFCYSVDYSFHSGSIYRQEAPAPEGMFYNRSDYSNSTTCVSMRFREGQLTVSYPDAYTKGATTSDELRVDAIKSADNLFNGIQTAYENVQMANARKAQGF